MGITATSATGSAQSLTPLSANSASQAAGFSNAMAASMQLPRTVFTSGRIGVELDTRGRPGTMIYFDEAGRRLTGSAFTAKDILKYAQSYGIDLHDLTGIGEQLDAAGIGYRPYELYKGTGSDHGVDFADLIAGGLGSAYDWRQDANASLKGQFALANLEAARTLADSLGLVLHSEVTTTDDIRASTSTPSAAAVAAQFTAATTPEPAAGLASPVVAGSQAAETVMDSAESGPLHEASAARGAQPSQNATGDTADTAENTAAAQLVAATSTIGGATRAVGRALATATQNTNVDAASLPQVSVAAIGAPSEPPTLAAASATETPSRMPVAAEELATELEAVMVSHGYSVQQQLLVNLINSLRSPQNAQN